MKLEISLREDKMWLVALVLNAGAAVWNWWAFFDHHNWLNLICGIVSTLITAWLIWRHPF